MPKFKFFQKNSACRQSGFTWPELIVITGVIAILFGFLTINLFNAQHRASVNSEVETVVADIKNQQTKAMEGSTDGRTSSDSYGIHFNTNSYVLFHGTTFNSASPDNSIINLDSGLQFVNITFPSSNIIFNQGGGSVSGFLQGSNTVTLEASDGTQPKTITVNRYGVIISVQ